MVLICLAEAMSVVSEQRNRGINRKTEQKMKKIILISLIFAILAFFVDCGGSEPGSIYGVVSDKATGEPIKNAGVELLPVGLKTVTGSDGSFEFLDISSGHYNLLVTKTGYSDTKSSTITVESGKKTKGDVQLEKAPAALRIIDDKGKEIEELDFGAKLDDVSRSFNIFNDSPDSINWEITVTAEWIKSVSKESGNLAAGDTLGIIVVIDRSLLREGENLSQLHITSSNGNKQLAIKAINSDVVTLDATRIKASSATLNGELIVNDEGYTETGFVYGGMATPSFDNNAKTVSNSVVQLGSFGNAISGLTEYAKYYYRAYAKNDNKTVYGEIKSFATLKSVETLDATEITVTSATLNGKLIFNDVGYTEMGFVYGEMATPSFDNGAKVVSNSPVKLGSFDNAVSGLKEHAKYYYRAYAKNDTKTVYGATKSFSTLKDELKTDDYVILPDHALMVARKDAGKAPWSDAIEICKSSTLAGFTNWRLPTKSELLTIYANKNYIGGFHSEDGYWSSTAIDDSCAWWVDFWDGNVSDAGSSKSNSYYVRCVRTTD